MRKKRIVVVGNGMVGHRVVEKLVDFMEKEENKAGSLEIQVFGEEPYFAYDRVALTSYFQHFNASELEFENQSWYEKNSVSLHTGDKVVSVDPKAKTVTSQSGITVSYDELVLATGSIPFTPPINGYEPNVTKGVFTYRTIADLDAISAWAKERQVKFAVVLGGGLLGLEAAQVCKDLPGIDNVRIVHRRGFLMNRQCDPKGGEVLGARIQATVGATLSLGSHITRVFSDDETHNVTAVELMKYSDSGKEVEEMSIVSCEMLILSVGIRPRDELAKTIETVEVHPKTGGVVVNDFLQSSDPNIHAVGECTSHLGATYGLVAPGYEMADVLARKLINHSVSKTFSGGDESTKLKLLGVDVASFGRYSDSDDDLPDGLSLRFHDPFASVYRRLHFNKEGTLLIGGVLVGDASDYAKLLMLCRGKKPLKTSPSELILPPKMLAQGGSNSAESGGVDEMDDSDRVCSCNDVSKGDICKAVTEKSCDTMGKIVACTKAGAGCGGCKPLIEAVMNNTLLKMGKTITNDMCPHFGCTRAELFTISKVNKLYTYEDLHKAHGRNSPMGCEICKPAVASIIASLTNSFVLGKDNAVIQDTNDRFLANIQRGGTYSVVPRIAGGEITPDKLAVIAEVGKKYNLYTKITGGQRIDMFGARREDLPEIWEVLVNAGFESGHAYGKSLRTVKSCVGSTWCRFGMLDSVAMAVRLENRYKGVRCPHKFKMAVSGCTRDCAEMANKDVGLVATSAGYDILVCGNGGMKPRLGDLLVSGVSEERAIQIIDRFYMYYIYTADRLQRTARWMEKLEGGLARLKEVILDDKLGICAELEKQMQFLVDSYQDEWKAVVEDPEKRAYFKQFINSDSSVPGIEFVDNGRGQKEPAPWPADQAAYPKVDVEFEEKLEEPLPKTWVKVANVSDVPLDGGVSVLYGKSEIAIYHVRSSGKWYATQNLCPHRNMSVLSTGIIGEFEGTPKVSCPVHKKPYSLETGKGLDGNSFALLTFPIKEENGQVYLELPSETELDKHLASEKLIIKKSSCSDETKCNDDRLAW